MKTIKIIDLLNKIANGEEPPKKIKYDDEIYEFKNNDYERVTEVGNIYTLFYDMEYVYKINKEVEIIEEKEIRKLPNEVEHPRNFEEVVYIAEDLVRKINELIDEVNKLKEEK